MTIKLYKILSIPVALILILAVTVVPAVAIAIKYKPIRHIKNPTVTSANVNVTVLENTVTSQKSSHW